MLQASYEIWGVAVIALLIGVWIVKRGIARKNLDPANRLDRKIVDSTCRDHDIEHRALMFLMTQKTDSVLAALARTIEQERQKLGGVVRKPSMAETIDALPAADLTVETNRSSAHDRIIPMANAGVAVPAIARQLQLPEAEVCMVMRLNAA